MEKVIEFVKANPVKTMLGLIALAGGITFIVTSVTG